MRGITLRDDLTKDLECQRIPLAFKSPYLPEHYALLRRHHLPTSLREKRKREERRQLIEIKEREMGLEPTTSSLGI